MEHITEILRQGFEEYGLTDKIDPWAITSLDEYCQRLLEKNQVMNLTAIQEPEGVARLHMLDCAALLKFCDFENKTLIDVGTGAGFPGMVLKIYTWDAAFPFKKGDVYSTRDIRTLNHV